MTYSFDIFDTCLIRVCGQPTFVFDLLAERIMGRDVAETQLMDFSNIRREAECAARRKVVSGEVEDVTLGEIYEECDFSALTPVDKWEIMRQEMALEREVLRPVGSVKERIDGLRSAGHKIVYISDMYLPEAFLREVMSEAGLYVEGDCLYVSSEYRKQKQTGNLFRLVQEREGIDRRRWTHYGDNPWSDVKVPRKLGIKAKRLCHPYSHSERLMGAMDMTSGKFNRKLCASFSRAVRLSGGGNSPEFDFAAEYIAPLWVSFVTWVLEDAKRRGIKRLYFLARDGQIFYEIAKTLQSCYPDIELHYLYVSRKALYLPGMKEISIAEIEKRITVEKNLTNVLNLLQMEEYEEHFKEYAALKDDELLSALFADTFFLKQVELRKEEQRSLCLQYFINVGLHKGNAAVVDLNGTRRCHDSINGIIHGDGAPMVYGYYFLVAPDRVIGGEYNSLNFRERLIQNRGVYKLPNAQILENYFSIANHETTSRYEYADNQIKPVFEAGMIPSDVYVRLFGVNRCVCCMYAELYQKYIGSGCAEQICKDAYGVVSDFFDAPEREYLGVVSNMVFSVTSHTHFKLIDKKPLLRVLRHRHDYQWLSGNLVFNSPFPQLVTYLLRLRKCIRKLKTSADI